MRYLLITLLFLPIQDDVGEGWDLKKDKNGIKIYTQLFPESSFKAFKAITVMEGIDRDGLMKILMDVDQYDRIFPSLEEATVIEKEGNYQLQYMQYDAPWPVSDRDGYYEQEIKIEGKKKILYIKCAPGDFPEDPDYIRMVKGHGYWSLEDAGLDRVKIIYEFRPDPAGLIPAWLANSVVVNNPYETLMNLREVIGE